MGIPPLPMDSLHGPEPQFPFLETEGPDADILGWLSSVTELWHVECPVEGLAHSN